MSFPQTPAEMPLRRIRRLARRVLAPAAIIVSRWVAALLPPSRREGRVIGFVGLVIVLFIAAFTSLILSHIEEASRNSNRQHVEQLLNSIKYQLGTTLVMIDQAVRHTGEEIREFNDPQKLVELSRSGLVPTLLLDSFFFIDPGGRVVASARPNSDAFGLRDLADREYFRVHLDTLDIESRIGRPVRSRLSGKQVLPVSHPVRQENGDLLGVLVAMIDLQALERIWVEIGLTPDDTIRLIGEDDAEWFMWPSRPGAGIGAVGGLSWSRRLAPWPMRVVATLDPATIDRHTDEARRAIVAAAAAGALMVVLFCLLLAHRARQATSERDAGDAVRARLLVAINAVPVEFIEYDRERRLIVANQAALNASPWRMPGGAAGMTINEIMDGYVAHFQSTDAAAAWRAWTEQTISDFDRGGVADSFRPDGQWRRSYVTKVPGGGWVVVRVDLSEMKLQEQKLAAEMERLNSVFQSTGASILMLDHDARVVMANRLTLDLNGATTAAEIVGRAYADLTTNALDPAVIARWQRASGETRLRAIRFESTAGAGNAKRSIRVTANPIQDEAGRLRYIVLIGVDDTERRMAEIRLFDAARLDHLGEMATGLAHEINQPLAVIRMASESLIEVLDTPEAAATPPAVVDLLKTKLDRICRQVERASVLVRNLRTLARTPTGASAPFDLLEAVRVGGGLLREQLKAARINFSLDLPPAGPMVRGQASHLQQVLISLVLNARDALLADAARPPTGRLGHIALRVAAAPGGGMELIVDDDGPGIPEAVLPRLFEPFFTTKAAGKGAGLGLSISYGIIKRMGGKITAENRAEGGARFRIAFPPL